MVLLFRSLRLHLHHLSSKICVDLYKLREMRHEQDLQKDYVVLQCIIYTSNEASK